MIYTRPRERELSEPEFRQIADTAKSIIGLHLEPTKKALIQARLSKRMRAVNVGSVAEYCALVLDPTAEERRHFVSALTTNVTHFFRERHHFEYLEKKIIPDLLPLAKKGRRIRIWSAGCSTGQEAYSIAGTILAMLPTAAQLDIKILASDIDTSVLQKAATGRFAPEDCRFDNKSDEAKIFSQRDESTTYKTVRKELFPLISFQQLNLMEDWSQTGHFDVIFCRNVAIYFDREAQSGLWKRFADRLGPDGTLIIGHSERIHGPAEKVLQTVGITTYQKSLVASAPARNRRDI